MHLLGTSSRACRCKRHRVDAIESIVNSGLLLGSSGAKAPSFASSHMGALHLREVLNSSRAPMRSEGLSKEPWHPSSPRTGLRRAARYRVAARSGCPTVFHRALRCSRPGRKALGPIRAPRSVARTTRMHWYRRYATRAMRGCERIGLSAFRPKQCQRS